MGTDLVFEVVGRSKTEKITKEGKRETVFKVSLKSTKGDMKLTVASTDSVLLTKYPLGGNVPLRIGVCDQVPLLSEEQLKKEIKKAADASDEEEPAR